VEAYVEDHNWDGGQIERVNLRLGLNSCARCIRLWISPLLFLFQNDWTLLDIEFPSRLKDFYPYGRQMRWSLEGSKWWWPNIKTDRIHYSVPTSWCRKISCLSHWFGPSYDSAFKRIEGCPSNCSSFISLCANCLHGTVWVPVIWEYKSNKRSRDVLVGYSYNLKLLFSAFKDTNMAANSGYW